jgi:hypothetical protein
MGIYRKNENCIQNFGRNNIKERGHFAILEVDGTVLKCVINRAVSCGLYSSGLL